MFQGSSVYRSNFAYHKQIKIYNKRVVNSLSTRYPSKHFLKTFSFFHNCLDNIMVTVPEIAFEKHSRNLKHGIIRPTDMGYERYNFHI